MRSLAVIIPLSFLIPNLFIGCSSTSTGMKKISEGTENSTSASTTASGSGADGNGESLPTKKELYDGIQIALGSNDDTAIEKAVASVLSQDQNDTKALNSLALFHLSKGRTPLAKMILKLVLDKDAKNVTALNNMGVIHSQLGEARLAAEFFRKALAVKSDYPIASANLGMILARGKDYGKAKKNLEIAYEGGIKDVAVVNNYAVALTGTEDRDAQKFFKEALQIGASDPLVAFNYALFLTYVKKDYKEANDILDKVRFVGLPANKKAVLAKMEETINGQGSVETKTP